MTEGIIQQVFGRFVVFETPYLTRDEIYLTRDEILELRDELIKEIRKEFSDFNVSWLIDAQTIRQNIISTLIGETKE